MVCFLLGAQKYDLLVFEINISTRFQEKFGRRGINTKVAQKREKGEKY
jgi:hypothetical protein